MRYFRRKSVTITDGSRGKIRILASDPGISKRIRDGIKRGTIQYLVKTLNGSERLDTLAGKYYGDSTLWWIIAAANGIGWALQVSPGIDLIIPTDPEKVFNLI